MEAREHGKQAVALAAAGQWSEALNHAHACHQQASADTAVSVWSLHVLACIYADAGVPRKARQFAREYLAQAESFPELERFTPFVLHALGSAHYQLGRWNTAFYWFNRAMLGFAQIGQNSKGLISTVNLAWTLLRMGRPAAAQALLPDRTQFPSELAYVHDGIQAALLAAMGNHESAIAAGRQGLSAPSRRACDFAEAAEVALVIAHSLRMLGADTESSAYIRAAASLCALQQWDMIVRLLLNERAGGGDPSEHTAAPRGSADLHHCGCYSSGVA